MKTNNVKKVLYIVILSLFIAITVATVVLAVIPKKLYNPINEGYGAITVYKDKTPNTYINVANNSEQDKEVIANIEKYHADSVKDNILSTLFQGTGSFEESVIYEEKATDCMSNVAKQADTVCLIFNYLDNEQTLIIDGKEYTHPNAKGEGKTIVYNKIFMPVTNNQDFQECTVYLADSSNKANFKITFLAHQSDLYAYLVGLNFDIVQ